jgi:hypothetical protein
MDIGEEQAPIELPVPVHPDEIVPNEPAPAAEPAPDRQPEPAREPSREPVPA